MAGVAVAIELGEADRRELESLARARKTGQALAKRARIALAAAAGHENKAICGLVGADPNTVSKSRRRFAERGLDGFMTSCARVRRAGSAMTRLPRRSD